MEEIATGSKVRIRNKRLSDAINDYAWQTSQEIARLDAAPVLTVAFSEYLSTYHRELRLSDTDRHVFAVETLDGKHIGNCVYYNVSESRREAELGIMIGDQTYWNQGYGSDAVAALVDYIFCHTNLSRIYLKTLEWNGRAQRCFQKCGFVPYGHMKRDGYNFALMEILRSQWEGSRTCSGVEAENELEQVN